jgi:hypothetical protein
MTQKHKRLTDFKSQNDKTKPLFTLEDISKTLIVDD